MNNSSKKSKRPKTMDDFLLKKMNGRLKPCKTMPDQTNKFDRGKIRFSLIPLNALRAIGEVLEFGANKYSANSWKKVRPYARYYDSALRHLYAWKEGEKKDPESDLSHLAHAACCVIFLLWFSLKGKGKKRGNK